jgi:hypothetical protein
MRKLRVVFKNTKALNQIDWDKEIANPDIEDMTDDQLAKLATRAVMRYNMALMYIGKGLEEKEANVRANTLRMLQYFYGLFIYYHGAFYNKPKDSNVREFTPDMKKIMKEHGKLERSPLPMDKIKKIQELFDGMLDKQEARENKEFPDGGFDELQKMFKRCGLDVIEPTCVSDHGDRDHGAIIHDGVEYILYLMKTSRMMGKRSLESAKTEAHDYQETVRRYHPLIKAIYEEIKKRAGKQVYAMPGGGAQHQVFFGDEQGYIACIGLDLKSSKKNRDSGYTLTGQGRRGDTLMKGFEMDGVKFQSCESMYGKEFMDEHYPIQEMQGLDGQALANREIC